MRVPRSEHETGVVRRSYRILLVACLVVRPEGPWLHAMIDPSFTPLHLVEESQRILAGKLASGTRPGLWRMADIQTLKGTEAGSFEFSLALPRAREAKEAHQFLSSCIGTQTVVFLSKDKGYLLIHDVWFTVQSQQGAPWKISEFGNQRMLKTYFGAADALIEMVDYILHGEDPDVPVAVGVAWRKSVTIGQVSAPVCGLACVVVGGSPGVQLFVASPRGDHLFAFDKTTGRFGDHAKALGMDTASRMFAFLDLNRDGAADVVSSDGSSLIVRLGAADGHFVSGKTLNMPQRLAPCTGLGVLSPGQDGCPGLVMSSQWPGMLQFDGTQLRSVPLPGTKGAYSYLGPAAPCIVGDWNRDGFADVLQPREQGSVLWNGRQGGFGTPVVCSVRQCGAPGMWTQGDFDGNGTEDLFVIGRESSELWESSGRGTFRPVIRFAGSLSYRVAPGASQCLATDLNHDGRTDVSIFYGKGDFQYHFNRGYRCMAEEGELRLDTGLVKRDASGLHGAIAAAAGDLNSDGSLDLAVAFHSGQIIAFFSELVEKPALWLRLRRGHTGPVTVSAWQGEAFPVCVGTYAVNGHAPPTYATVRTHGPCTVKWRYPGEPEKQRQIVVTAKPPTIILN